MSAEPKFLCDGMLAHLGKLLRMAGYDAAIADGAKRDYELVLQAKAENRWILTRDRAMREIKAATDHLLFLTGKNEDAWARELSDLLGVNWLHAPFTLCLECNLRLEPAPAEEKQRMPPEIQKLTAPLLHCPGCRRLFWEGSHARRMRARLENLSDIPKNITRNPVSP